MEKHRTMEKHQMSWKLISTLAFMCAIRCLLFAIQPSMVFLVSSSGNVAEQLLLSGIALMPIRETASSFSIVSLSGIKECYYLLNIPGCQKITFDPPLHAEPRPTANCSQQISWFRVRGNSIIREERSIRRHPEAVCSYHPLINHNGLLYVNSGEHHPLTDPVKDEFIVVECIENDRIIYQEFFPFIYPVVGPSRPDPLKSKKAVGQSASETLNVIMIGLESTPKSDFFRHMKHTLRFIHENLPYIELQGHLRSGPADQPSVITALTGMSSTELERWRQSKEPNWNPFIWTDFAKAGYRTLLSDSDPANSVFGKSGFVFAEPPTDHYLPPINKAYVEQTPAWNGGCVNNGVKTSTLLRWVGDFLDFNQDQPLFSIMFLNGITNKYQSAVEHHDMRIVEFLTELRNKQHLLHSIVILFGDTQNHFRLHSTFQEVDEEEVPFMIFLLPPWFAKKYPERYANLRSNEHVMTSSYDVHETLRDILRLRGSPQLRDRWSPGKNLMQPINKHRSCQEAGVEEYWCSCLQWTNISFSNEHVGEAALASIEAINGAAKLPAKVALTTAAVHLDSILESRQHTSRCYSPIARSDAIIIQLIFGVRPTRDVYISVVHVYEENQWYKYEVTDLNRLIDHSGEFEIDNNTTVPITLPNKYALPYHHAATID